MTIRQAIDIALTYAKIDGKNIPEALLLYYADVAQKDIALNTFKITKRYNISKKDSKPLHIYLPDDNIGFHNIMRRGSALPIEYTVINDKELVVSDYGEFDIYYNVLPKTIDLSTRDDYSFEVHIKTHCAIPFYIASKIAKDATIAETCFCEWNTLNSLVKSYRNSNKEYNKYYL